MPSIVGPVQITSINSGGILHFGDAVVISPKEATKSANGSGSGNIGLFVLTNNLLNGNNILDTKLVDQPILGNN
ncbi:spore germination protein [Peribacillus sp. SCS-37]|uniref:spore germination protein n=1 Tax=Paraperibacillus esterisolvens TaxID=3115296 RepID=UPI0039063E0C